MKLCLMCNFQTAADEQDICPRDGSSMVTVGDDPLLGLVIEGRYRIESVMGQGSAGTVYKAVQELIGREVAIKVLHDYLVSDNEFIKRFTQEAKASSRLSHPNIITIYDFGIIPKGSRPYIAMDLLKGTPLSDLISERNHLPLDEVLPIFKQICAAFGEAHRQGVIHRDIKPANIVLVERSGQKLFPIVVDFGIARLVQGESERITRTGTVCGSPTYMSPEQCTSSKVDHRSDIYSLGIVLYETLTGEVPFLADELVKVMSMHLSEPPKSINAVRPGLRFSEELEEVVYRVLNKNPDLRYQSMQEFADALEEAGKAPVKPPSVQTQNIASLRDFSPGPLANAQAATYTHEHIPALTPPLPKPRDLANRALEELVQRSPAATHTNIDLAQMRAPAETRERTRDLGKRNFPIAFAVAAVLAVVVFAANDSHLNRFLPWLSFNSSSNSPDDLLKRNKIEDAIPMMLDLKRHGKLNKTQTENLNKICLGLAKQYAKEGRYSEAISLLEQVSTHSSQSDTAKVLLRKYRQQNK